MIGFSISLMVDSGGGVFRHRLRLERDLRMRGEEEKTKQCYEINKTITFDQS